MSIRVFLTTYWLRYAMIRKYAAATGLSVICMLTAQEHSYQYNFFLFYQILRLWLKKMFNQLISWNEYGQWGYWRTNFPAKRMAPSVKGLEKFSAFTAFVTPPLRWSSRISQYKKKKVKKRNKWIKNLCHRYLLLHDFPVSPAVE